ncbi:metal ABC transporter permease [Humidisolicoccus flavus]|uniref:metal ABC transporter permease n=1 Tax=Humidisolicoccus flavus TaxID=3111414 RepID=UPI00324F0D9A
MESLLTFDYFTRALIEVVLAGALAGLVGVLVVIRQRAFFTMALTHATFPGAVIAALLGIAVPIGAALAAVVLIGVMMLVGRNRTQGSAVASGIVLTFGFALGTFVQSIVVVPIDVESFLIGSVLSVNNGHLALTASMLVLVAVVLIVFGRQLVFSSFDASGFRAFGLRLGMSEALTLLLIAATVVCIMPVVGAILGVALIVAPAAAARLLTGNVRGMFVIAPLLGICSGVAGLLLSRTLGTSAGGTIVLVATAIFLLATVIRRGHRLGLKAS